MTMKPAKNHDITAVPQCERTDDAPSGLEVHAAARVLNAAGWTCYGGAHEPGEYDDCADCRRVCEDLALAALGAARAATR